MSKFSQYPCCACMINDGSVLDSGEMIFHSSVFQNICKLGEVDIKRMIQSSLQLISFQINPKLVNFTFIQGTMISKGSRKGTHYTLDGENLAQRESTMNRCIYNLLKELYAQNPSDIDIDNVHNLEDIGSVLTKELDEILEVHNRVAENPYKIINGNGTFQKLVLDILLFAAKFMSRCINDLKDIDKLKIFNIVVETVDKFMFDRNITSWIVHSIQVMDPFGK